MTEVESSTWIDVGPLTDFADAPLRRSHGGVHALVSILDGDAYALEDSCLHRGASLQGGVCSATTITCPSHWWRYDLRTGALQGSPGHALRTFEARIVGNRVEVCFPAPQPKLGMREMLLAHARLESQGG